MDTMRITVTLDGEPRTTEVKRNPRHGLICFGFDLATYRKAASQGHGLCLDHGSALLLHADDVRAVLSVMESMGGVS